MREEGKAGLLALTLALACARTQAQATLTSAVVAWPELIDIDAGLLVEKRVFWPVLSC